MSAARHLFFVLYIATAPIFWVPGIQTEVVQLLKLVGLAGFLVAVLLGNQNSSMKRKLPLTLVVPLWALAALVFPFFYNSLALGHGWKGVSSYYLNYLIGFMVAIASFNTDSSLKAGEKSFTLIFLLTSVVSIPPLLNSFTGYPDWSQPIDLQALRNETAQPFWCTGFHGSRTGWSIALASAVPMVIAAPWMRNVMARHVGRAILGMVPVGVIILAQVVSQGRGGLLASTVSVLLCLRKHLSVKLTMFIVTLATTLAAFSEPILDALRITDEAGMVRSLDEVSASRLSLNVAALQTFLDSPFFGQGMRGSAIAAGASSTTESLMEVHNAYLRVFVDHGIFFGMGILWLSVYVAYISIRLILRSECSTLTRLDSAILISGLLAASFEPNTIFGSFQQIPIWWYSLGNNLRAYQDFIECNKLQGQNA